MAIQVLELYTTNAILLSKALIAVVNMIGSDAFSNVMYMAAMIGFVAMLANFALGTGKTEWIGYVLAILLASTGVKTTTTVGLIDSAGGNYRVVEHVPIIIAVPFYIINSGARVLTDLSRFYFSAAGADILQNGVGYGTALIASMQNIRWSEANVAVSGVNEANKSKITVQGAIEGYINDCYIPYMTKKDSNASVTSVLYQGTTHVASVAELWELFNTNIVLWSTDYISPASASGTPKATCNDQFTSIKTVLISEEWKAAIISDFASTYYALSSSMDRPGSASVVPAGTTAALNADQLSIKNDLEKYVNYMLGTSDGNDQAATILLMDYLSKALNVGLSQDGRLTLTEYKGRAGSAFNDAIGQNNLSMAAEGDFFVKYAGNMTRFIEFLTYLWLPITLFAMLALPGGIKQLKNIFFLYLWIQSWPFAFNIINYYQVLDTLETLRPILSGGMNMFDLESVWASTTRAFATSQMFLGMLPILTMALLTGNMMSMSRLSDKVSGHENLDEKRIRRDSEKVDAASVFGAQGTQTVDRDGNAMTSNSTVDGATSHEIAQASSDSATKNEVIAKTATAKSSAAFNKLVGVTESGQQFEQFLESTSSSLQVNDSVNLSAMSESGVQHAETFQKLKAVQTSLKGKVAAKVSGNIFGVAEVSAGVEGAASISDTEAVTNEMKKQGLTKEAVVRALSSIDALQIQGTTSVSGTDMTSEQEVLAKTVNEQSEVATQATEQAQRQKAFSTSITSKKTIPSSKKATFADHSFDQINKHHEILGSGTADKDTLKKSEEFANKYFGGKENMNEFVNQTSGENRTVRAQQIRNTEDQFLQTPGVDPRSMINFMMMEDIMPGNKLANLMMDSQIINPIDHKDGGVDQVAEDNIAEVADSRVGDKITSNSGQTVTKAVSDASGVQQEVKNTIENTDTSLTPEQQAEVKRIEERASKAKAQQKAMKEIGKEVVTDANIATTAPSMSDNPTNTYTNAANKLGVETKNDGVVASLGKGIGNELLSDKGGLVNNIVGEVQEAEDSGFGGLESKVTSQFEDRAKLAFVSASDGYKDDINKGVSEPEAEFNRIGELMKLLGPDESANYQKELKNYKKETSDAGKDIKTVDSSDFLSQHLSDLGRAGIPTKLNTNHRIAAGLKDENDTGVWEGALSIFGLESSETETHQNNEKTAESALSYMTAQPNAMNTEAKYQSEQILIDSLKTLLEMRGGESLTDVDIQMARTISAQPYATAGGEGGQYADMVGDLFRKHYNDQTSTLEGDATMMNQDFQSGEFGKYNDQSTNGFDRIIEQVVEAQANQANQAALDNESDMAIALNAGNPAASDDQPAPGSNETIAEVLNKDNLRNGK